MARRARWRMYGSREAPERSRVSLSARAGGVQAALRVCAVDGALAGADRALERHVRDRGRPGSV